MNQPLTDGERRLVNYFKQFMERSIVPTIKNYGNVMADWQSFGSMIGAEPLDHSRIQSWLEGRSSSVKMFPPPSFNLKKDDDKTKGSSGFLKRKEDTPETPTPQAPNSYSFSNKTFGGERARMNMFPMKPNPIPQKKEEKPSTAPANERIFNSIESLYKTLSDNQYRFEHSNGTNNHAPSPTLPYGKYEERRYG